MWDPLFMPPSSLTPTHPFPPSSFLFYQTAICASGQSLWPSWLGGLSRGELGATATVPPDQLRLPVEMLLWEGVLPVGCSSPGWKELPLLQASLTPDSYHQALFIRLPISGEQGCLSSLSQAPDTRIDWFNSCLLDPCAIFLQLGPHCFPSLLPPGSSLSVL